MLSKIRGWTSKAAAVLAVSAGLALLSPSPAYAGGACTLAGCSETYNYSGTYATALQNWTCGWGTTGSWSTGCAGGATYGLPNGYKTPDNQDWDVFRVDAGWCYRVVLEVPGKTWEVTYDRRGSSTPVYVKVENWGTAYIVGQSSSSCP
ncbi:hypothetical protein [Streptomyces sp. NBC_01233]|uniref:hypothetical protein n=1 Tax=Streptomyces sp. NBC_01233 TaxID=2903787 RepID=UPI002E142123|nr:hypothetical protein OG332_22360 [Streptomyces sp. NBC_01233]